MNSIRKIARYIPAILLGIFAIDKEFQGKGLGTNLLKKAVNISLKISSIIGCRCLIVDSLINEQLLNFYLKIGFEFVNENLGRKILRKLQNGGTIIDRNTIKLYLDFHKIREL
ncbi:MAG: GNAT family N-acetyltransferase [Promethearchaeota archaeon]